MKPLSGPIQAAAAATQVKMPTRRALAKQQTRAKVLAAARSLFSEQGYEGATIRDIAAAAGMSTGAVFANFSDKSDLFREIMVADIATLAAKMSEAVERSHGVEDALSKLFMAGYAFYKSQMPLARAAFSVSWSPDDGHMLRDMPGVQVLVDLIARQLDEGLSRGELVADCEIALRAQMLFDSYQSNFAYAIFEGWSMDALQTRSRDQIRIILAGARRG